jgi:phage terminase large subunit GpA-like protein
MIGEHQKTWMLKHGEWRAARPDREVAGFWINSLYSPWRRWRDLTKKFLIDRRSPETLRESVNTVLAEPWDDEAQTSVDMTELVARREHCSAPVPAGVAILTCGVDVQADRLELELVGWGRGEESWSIEYRVIPGDPTGAAVWTELDEYLQRQRRHEHDVMLPVSACCIDSGYESQAVYDFCRTRYHRRVFAVKGQGGPHPVWPKKRPPRTFAANARGWSAPTRPRPPSWAVSGTARQVRPDIPISPPTASSHTSSNSSARLW